MDILQTLLNRRNKPKYSAWQVELTTRCPLRCKMCIKDEYRNPNTEDMSFSNFMKIVPHLKNVENVVLEGWGESLLYKDLTECIRLVKQQGSKVGFVTSGSGLNNDYIHRLIYAGIDFIGFSLSGATPETHNSIRVNSDFDTLINSIKQFKYLIHKNNSFKAPRMHIVYLLLKENIDELPTLIQIAQEIGIDEIIALNIIQISSRAQDDEKIFASDDEARYNKLINEAVKKARQWNINLVLPNIIPDEVSICGENPLKNLYISVEGEVSPCVFLSPPVSSPFKRIFLGKEHLVNKVSFGNIFRESIEIIWHKKEYTEFREYFIQRQKISKEIYRSLLEMKKPVAQDMPLPPPSCRTCHKMLGF